MSLTYSMSLTCSISLTTMYAQVIGEPTVVAGNSLGGYASLATAVRYPDLVKGVVLLNAAGRFEEVKAEAQAQVEAALPSTEAGRGAKEALREASGCCPSLLFLASMDSLHGYLCLGFREAENV